MPQISNRFRAALSSADASTATAIPLYLEKTGSAHTLASDSVLEIGSVQVVAAAADADIHVFCGPDGTPAAGETLVRGDFTNAAGEAGIVMSFPNGFVAEEGSTLWIITDGAVQVDVVITGIMRRA